MVPCRTADSRRADPSGALPTGATRVVALVGLDDADGGAPGGCAIPDDALAVETAVTAVAPTGNGFLRAWPRAGRAPDATLLNFRRGASTTNTGALPRRAGTEGDVSLRAFGSSTDVVLDAFGWYSPPGETVPVSLSNGNSDRLYPADDGSELFFDSGLPSGVGLHRWHESEEMSFVLGQPLGPIAAAGDGSVIAFNSRASDLVPPRGESQATDVWTYEPGTDDLRRLTQLEGIAWAGNVSITGDGRHVSFASGDDLGSGPSPTFEQDLYLFDRVTADVTLLTTGDLVDGGPVSLSDDGSLATFTATTPGAPNDRKIYLWRRSTGAAELLSLGGPSVWDATISADGSTVAFQVERPGGAAAIALHDVATGTTDVVTPDDDLAAAPSLSGDGRFLSYLAYDPGALSTTDGALRLLDRDTGATATIAAGELARYWPTMTRDGRSVFFGNGPVSGAGDPVPGATQLYRWQRPST
jgi:hypothetical protein